MKLSIHTTKGKPAKTDYVDLGNNWINIETDWAEAYQLITVDGHATSAEINTDNRIQANFVSRQLIMVDVDNDKEDQPTMSITELLEHEFYNAYGAGFYATHSFKPEHHKFRICFVLEVAETDSSRLRKIVRGLLKVFPAGDKACCDPVRLFYGSPDCKVKEFRTNILTAEATAALVAGIEEEDAVILEKMSRVGEIAPLTQPQRRKILELLKQTFVGDYHIWRNIGWGLKAGGFTLPDFQYVTAGLMRLKTPEAAAGVWNDGKQIAGGVTMGSVVFLLQERHGKDCLKERTNWRTERATIINKYL